MSLPHWIKWNKVKGKYEINNNMDCFEQSIENELNIPKYDNIKKIGSKSKLLEFFESVKDEYTNLDEWKIFKIGRTYYIDIV